VNLEIYSIKYGETTLTEDMVFSGGSKDSIMPISLTIYLIKTDNRNILIDAGCDTMPGFVLKNFRSPALALKDVGISPDEITDVIITHAHHDHIDALKHFGNATVHITEKQYNRGKKYITADCPVNIISGIYTVTEHIKVIEWGGHDFGSAITEVYVDDKTFVFAGDECYTNANLRDKLCTGCYVNKESAIKFVQKYSDSKYTVYTCHDSILKTERIL